MSEIKWIKIVTDIFDDEKILLIESLPEADSIIIIWFKLLCLAGKQNNSGVFIMNNGIAYTDTMLATIFRRKEATVKMALEVFQQFGMIEIMEGAITIPNWGKHQSIDMLQDRRDYMRDYMRKYRENQRGIACGEDDVNGKVNCKVNVNLQEEDKNKKRKRKENIYPAFFQSFWDVYPRKKEKSKALKCFRARINEGCSEELLIEAAKAYAEECEATRQEERFIKYPATFLGPNRPFEDYILREDNEKTLSKTNDGRILQ